MNKTQLDTERQRISEARHHDPFSILGRHQDGNDVVVRAFVPLAEEVRIAEGDLPLTRLPGTDHFEWRGDGHAVPTHYSLLWRDQRHREHITRDPYSFAPQIGDLDLHLFGEGRHRHAGNFLGAHEHQVDGVAGVLFAVWAPNAERVERRWRFQRLGWPSPPDAREQWRRCLGAVHPRP